MQRLIFWILVTLVGVAVYYVVSTRKSANELEQVLISPTTQPLEISDRYIPKVYEVLNVRRQSNDWYFMKETSEQFYKDVRSSKISMLMISGSIYVITDVRETPADLVLTLENRCNSKFYSICPVSEQTLDSTKYSTMLHVLGYQVPE